MEDRKRRFHIPLPEWLRWPYLIARGLLQAVWDFVTSWL